MPDSAPYSLLIQHAAQVLTLAGGPTDRPLAGPDLGSWRVIDHGFVACQGTQIAAVGAMAELDATRIDPAGLVRAARLAGDDAEAVVCEGVGGLLVPLTPAFSVRDLAAELGLALVIAARPGLGTINHTLLTVEAARSAGLRVAGIVMTPWPDEPDAMARSNRETVQELTAVTVSPLSTTEPRALAEAGATLPLDEWLA